jgi:hypothetical protein
LTLLGTFDPAEAQEDGGIGEQTPTTGEDDAAPSSGVGLVQALVGDFVDDVLADLVEEETITQTQADKIAAAFDARLDELVADLPRIESLLGEDGPLPGFLEDGHLTDEERAELEELLGEFAPFGPRGFRFFTEDGQVPEELRERFEGFDPGSLPFRGFFEDGELSEEERGQLDEMFGNRFSEGHGFRFFLEDGEVPEELQELFESFDLGAVPFGDFLEDGKLSIDERAQLREFFSQFRGRGFGGLFEGLEPADNADEAAFSA